MALLVLHLKYSMCSKSPIKQQLRKKEKKMHSVLLDIQNNYGEKLSVSCSTMTITDELTDSFVVVQLVQNSHAAQHM